FANGGSSCDVRHVSHSSCAACPHRHSILFFFHAPATTEIYTLSLHDALPIWAWIGPMSAPLPASPTGPIRETTSSTMIRRPFWPDRKSTRLNSSHLVISYAVFCLKKKKTYSYTNHSAWFKSVSCPIPSVSKAP